LVGIALVLFLLGAAFFEGIVGISGYQFDHSAGVVLGALIIALGALMLVLTLTSSGRRSRSANYPRRRPNRRSHRRWRRARAHRGHPRRRRPGRAAGLPRH